MKKIAAVFLSILLLCTLAAPFQVTGLADAPDDIIYQALGTAAPPSTLGGYTVLTKNDGYSNYANINAIPTVLGDITLDKQLNARKVSIGWGTWSHQYTGRVYYCTANQVRLTMPSGVKAFVAYVEPNNNGPYSISATANDGTVESQNVNGVSGAAGYGFYSQGDASITTVSISVPSGAGGFAIGEIYVNKGAPAAPAAPVLSATYNSITAEAVAGCEYSLDGTTWTDSNTFASGIEPNRQYTVYARYKETQTVLASASSSSQITTPKAPAQTAPAAPVLSATYQSITVEAMDGCEYSLDDTSWTDSTTFASGIEASKQYTVYARYKETQSTQASPSSSAQITTLEAPKSAPVVPEGIKISGGTVSQEATSSITNFVVNLKATESSVTVAPAYANAKMTIDGKRVVSKTIKLDYGKSVTLTVKVTTKDKTLTYKLTVNRPKSGDNRLSWLSVTRGKLSPKFNPAITNYTVTLPKGVYSCVLNWKIKDAHSKVIINEKLRYNWRFGLHYGQTETINILVYAQDGSSKVYTVTARGPGAQ